ncbi:hypothetical protein H0H93_012004 [Arthromyces matolae]|nr:hypothetical protein H0H93_012004 [Arthromyces matolae]
MRLTPDDLKIGVVDVDSDSDSDSKIGVFDVDSDNSDFPPTCPASPEPEPLATPQHEPMAASNLMSTSTLRTRPRFITVGHAPPDCGSYPSTPPDSPTQHNNHTEIQPPPYTPSSGTGELRRSRRGIVYEVGRATHPSELFNFTGQPGVQGFYVVYIGQRTGIFHSWGIAKPLTDGVPGCHHESFTNWQAAYDAYCGVYSRSQVEARILDTGSAGRLPSSSNLVALATARLSAMALEDVRFT